MQLASNLTNSLKLKDYIAYSDMEEKKSIEQKTLPADLLASLKFVDKDSIIPNNMIDAGESCTIIVNVENKGKGTAFNVNIETQTNFQNIQVESPILLGDIQPGKSKETVIPIKGGVDLKDGPASIFVIAKEKRGYNSKKIRINVSAVSLSKPDIVISGYRLNDSNQGLAQGNGNGIPENGETIELITFIKNTGVGDSIETEIKIVSIDSQIKVDKPSAKIDRIAPGQTITARLAFTIPSTYTGKDFKIDLAAKDVRGVSESKKLVVINTQNRTPLLAYTYSIIDYNNNGVLENGEEAELEIVPINNGAMEARDIRIEVASSDLEFISNRVDIQRIGAQGSYAPQRFPFRVPRTIEKDKVAIRVLFAQKDFSGLEDTIVQELRLSRPSFTIAHQILDHGNRNGRIEEGETADIIVRVVNTGNLDAQDVMLTLNTGANNAIQEGVRLMGKSTVSIGRIGAGQQSAAQTFTIATQRRGLDDRDLKLQFQVEQRDFQNADMLLALQVYKEEAEVITVAGSQEVPAHAPLTFAAVNRPPVIAIGTPFNEQRVAASTIQLSGMVSDDNGVASIEIMVNARRLEGVRDIGVHQIRNENQKNRPFAHQLPLEIGSNTITVRAYDLENLSSEHSLVVHRESERGDVYAAVIGIDRYQHVPSLRFARKDAEAFRNYLRHHMGVSDANILQLYDHEATSSAMRSLLGTQLPRMARKSEETVLIFFAEHGALDSDEYSLDGDGISKYILSHEAEPGDYISTAIPMDEIARFFQRIRAERLIFISDSCFSGASGGRTILAQGTRAGNLSDAFLDRLAKGKGRIILTSSSANEVSEESDAHGHGVFTHYLLEGLQGAADLDGDRFIDAHEISRYLKIKVPEATQGRQNPVMKSDSEGLVIMGKVP